MARKNGGRPNAAGPEYQYIRVWGAVMGSYSYYVEDEQQRAANDHAPKDAIYHTFRYEDGSSASGCYSPEEMKRHGITRVWRTVRDLNNASIRLHFTNMCHLCKVEPPTWQNEDEG